MCVCVCACVRAHALHSDSAPPYKLMHSKNRSSVYRVSLIHEQAYIRGHEAITWPLFQRTYQMGLYLVGLYSS